MNMKNIVIIVTLGGVFLLPTSALTCGGVGATWANISTLDNCKLEAHHAAVDKCPHTCGDKTGNKLSKCKAKMTAAALL